MTFRFGADDSGARNCIGFTASVFIDGPQNEVIEKILRHCGLWQASAARGPPGPFDLVQTGDSDLFDQTSELTYVDMDTFLANF